MMTRRTNHRTLRRRRLEGKAGLLIGGALVLWGTLGWLGWAWNELRLSNASQTTTATVVRLHEALIADEEAWGASPSPTYHYYVTYRFRPRGANEDRFQTQEISAAAYGHLVAGANVPVRYVPYGSQAATIVRYWHGAQSASHLGVVGVGLAILVMSAVIGLGKMERQHAWADSGESA